MRNKLILAAAFLLGAGPAFADVCANGELRPWSSPVEEAAAQDYCAKYGGGTYARCSNRSMTCSITGTPLKKGVKVTLPYPAK